MKLLHSVKKIFSLLMVCVVLSLTVCSSYISGATACASASSELINKYYGFLVNYLGLCQKTPAGISGIPAAAKTALLNTIEAQANNGGIYEDSNGNIVFGSAAMSAIYSNLNSIDTNNVRIISDFSNFQAYGPDQYNLYVNGTYTTAVADLIAEKKNSGKPYIFYSTVMYYVSDNRPICSHNFYAVTLNENFAYLQRDNVSSDYVGYRLKRSNGNNLSLTFDHVYCDYNYYGQFTNQTYTQTSFTCPDYFLGYSRSDNGDLDFQSFPTISYSHDDGIFNQYDYYCSSSLIIAKSAAYFNQAAGQGDGTFIYDTPSQIVVNKNVVIDNDWTSIYNSYITNVNNDYLTIINNNGGDGVTASELRKIMKKYINVLYQSIEEGLTNIADKINYVNEWLSKIYSNTTATVELLDELITAVSSGGASSVWTREEVEIVCDKLTYIYNDQVESNMDIIAALVYIKNKLLNMDDSLTDVSDTLTAVNSNSVIIVDSLDIELARLATIMGKLDDILAKMGPGIDFVIDPDLFDDIDDLIPDDLIDDVFDPFAAIAPLMAQVVPLCYLYTAIGILQSFSAPAMTPHWEIPVKIPWAGIDEVFVVDMSQFETIAVFLRAIILISITVGLGFTTTRIVNRFVNIFSS